MASRSGPGRYRFPSFRGGLIVYAQKGRIRAQAWPRRRGKPKSLHTQYMNWWMRNACEKMKFVDGKAVDWAYRITKQTGLYPRDVLMRSMTRGLWIIPAEGGGFTFPKPMGLYQVAFQGIRLQKTGNQSVAAGPVVAIAWQVATIETVGMFDPAQPTRITIPPGVSIARFTFELWNTSSINVQTELRLLRNGVDLMASTRDTAAARSPGQCDSGPLPVTPGDYFEATVIYSSARTVLAGDFTYFCCEILAADIPEPV